MISWVDRFARLGYMCQGTVFILIGILASWQPPASAVTPKTQRAPCIH